MQTKRTLSCQWSGKRLKVKQEYKSSRSSAAKFQTSTSQNRVTNIGGQPIFYTTEFLQLLDRTISMLIDRRQYKLLVKANKPIDVTHPRQISIIIGIGNIVFSIPSITSWYYLTVSRLKLLSQFRSLNNMYMKTSHRSSLYVILYCPY